MNILIPVEISVRELPYKVFLSNQLASKGFKCYIGSKNQIRHLMKKVNNFIYIDKGYHKGKSERLYNLIKSNGGLIINLDEEGALDFSDNSTLSTVRYPPSMQTQVDYIFLWGSNQYELIKSNTEKRNKLIVTGHPKFELLKQKYHGFYEEQVNKIKKQYGKFILINTNMASGNNIAGDASVIKSYQDRVPSIKKIINLDKKKIEDFKDLISKLSDRIKHKIIIRPHPEEKADNYIYHFKNNSNVLIINEGAVIPWLLSCEVMIHADCTTGIESFFLGKKAISFVSKSWDQSFVSNLPLKASHCFNDIESVIKFISNKSYTKEIDYQKYEFADSDFSFSENSVLNVCNEIYNLIESISNSSLLNFFDKLELKLIYMKNSLFTTDSLLKNKLRSYNDNVINELHKNSKLVNSDFEFNKLEKITGNLHLFSR